MGSSEPRPGAPAVNLASKSMTVASKWDSEFCFGFVFLMPYIWCFFSWCLFCGKGAYHAFRYLWNFWGLPVNLFCRSTHKPVNVYQAREENKPAVWSEVQQDVIAWLNLYLLLEWHLKKRYFQFACPNSCLGAKRSCVFLTLCQALAGKVRKWARCNVSLWSERKGARGCRDQQTIRSVVALKWWNYTVPWWKKSMISLQKVGAGFAVALGEHFWLLLFHEKFFL